MREEFRESILFGSREVRAKAFMPDKGKKDLSSSESHMNVFVSGYP